MTQSKKPNWFYSTRDERAKWIVERFWGIFSEAENVLDVGCWNKHIRKYLPPKVRYLGIDIAGNPDLFIDLDKIERLPFEDNSFDVVLALDVLEHLENIHLIFDELCRVSRKYIIITLPNPAKEIWRFILKRVYADSLEKRKIFGKYSKFYGLPFEVPPDRHRWFFSYDEAIEFVNYRATRNNCSVSLIETDVEYHANFLRKIFYKLIPLPENLIVGSIIILLQKSLWGEHYDKPTVHG